MATPNEFFKGSKHGFEFIKLDGLCNTLGIAEPPLRFFIGIVMGFPFALIFLLLPRKAANFRHLYIALCGMLISYFCFGTDMVFPLLSVLVTHISLIFFGGTMANVVFNFLFHMTYMLGAYVFYASDGYDVKWTTPQCILCLRLIGLAWDCYDGKKDKSKLKGELLLTRYEGTPTFLEICGYSYFFGGFMAGPQFSFQRYIKFVEDRLIDKEGLEAKNSRFFSAFKRVVGGIVAIAVFSIYDPQYPASALHEEEFLAKPFFTKCTQITLTYHIHFCKYVTIWYFCESVCMITGLAYAGTKDGKAKWDGVRNFKFRRVLFGAFFQDMLEGFNINTSQWAGRYVFKRLIFLGNKYASHVLTLLFLSLWHGFYIGYLILFAIEFILIIEERQLCLLLGALFNTKYDDLPLPLRLAINIFGAVFRAYACAFAAAAFMLLRWRRIKIAYGAVYYWLPITLVVGVVLILLLQQVVSAKKRKEKDGKKD